MKEHRSLHMTFLAWMLIALGGVSTAFAQAAVGQSAAASVEVASGRSPWQSDRLWSDPSPHKVHFVKVGSASVRLEVLDWGGAGRPILFVGCYLTAHAYDDIGPKLTDQFRVYAVTRRGVGASDHPPTRSCWFLSRRTARCACRAKRSFEMTNATSLVGCRGALLRARIAPQNEEGRAAARPYAETKCHAEQKPNVTRR